MIFPLDFVRRFAAAAKLKKRELLDDDDDVSRDCNGIGAGWFPAWLRDALSAEYPALYAASFIHDREYAIGGSALHRLAADWRFLCNGISGGIYCYGFFSFRNAVNAAASLRFFLLLRLGGVPAWKKK